MVIRRMIALLVGASVLAACGGTDNGNDSAPATGAVDTTAPDTAVPDTTAPDTTAPDTTAPDTTAPDTTVPDTTVPDTTAPDTTDEVAVAGSFEEADLGDPYLGPLTYRPFGSCSVPVNETVAKGDSTAELIYRLRFASEGDLTVMSWEDLRVITMDGEPVPEERADVLAVAFRVPELVVDADGRVVDVRGTALLIEMMDRLTPGSAGMLENPQAVALIENSVMERYWYKWIGLWADWGSFEDPVEEGYSEVESGRQTFTMTSQGTTGGGLAAFSFDRVVEGQQLLDQIGATIEQIAPDVPAAGAFGNDDRGRLVDIVEIVTDPTTLWPRSVLVEQRIDLTIDGESRAEVDRRLSVLRWDVSDCT